MSTTLAIRFPLGRYHATPWDRASTRARPSGRRRRGGCCGALVATWHTRWPDLPAPVLDGLLDALGDPPSYRTPRDASRPHPALPARPRPPEGRDRPHRPDPRPVPRPSAGTRTCSSAGTPTCPTNSASVLAKLAELLPYLGRAESVCEARLLDIRPGTGRHLVAAGRGRVRAGRGCSRRPGLSAGRCWRRPRWTSARGAGRCRQERGGLATRRTAAGFAARIGQVGGRSSGPVTAVRFAVMGRVPLKATHGILLADEAHRQAGLALSRAKIPDDHRQRLLGTDGAATDHRHAHWIPLADG